MADAPRSPGTSLRVTSVLALMPVAVACARLAHGVAAPSAFLRLYERMGSETPELSIIAIAAAFTPIGALLAGLFAMFLSPRALVVAVGLLTGACFLLAAHSEFGTVIWGFRLEAAGDGALRACLVGLALVLLPTARLRTLCVVLLVLAGTGADFIGNTVGAVAANRLGGAASFDLAGAIALCGVVPVVLVLALDRFSERSEVEARDPSTRGAPAALAAIITPLAMAPLIAGSAALTWLSVQAGGTSSTIGTISSIHAAIDLCALLAVTVFVVAWPRAPLLPVIGAGLLVAAAALGVAPPASASPAAASSTAGCDWTSAMPLAQALALRTLPPRMATVGVAWWILALSFGPAIAGFGLWAVGGMALVCAIFGVLVLVFARAIAARLDEPVPAARESWLHGQATQPTP
ncbi:MAG TPA: hypothetical protein VGO62_04430 [Myxococcota bacterium]|jgi:hypothetical protein